MALNNDAVFTAAKGYVYVAPVGTVAPTPTIIGDFTEATTGLNVAWTDLGHTSREDLPEFGFEGGETETRGTWRAAALKQVVTEVPVDYVTINLHQFDDLGLSLYYGVANASTTDGEFAVADAATATTERALLIIIEDGDERIGFHAPKAAIGREDALAISVDEFGVLPLRATFLKHNTAPLFSWINENFINPAA